MELPSESSLRGLAARYGDLVARLGSELGTRPLVLPNGEFFPDRFAADERGAQALVRRMRTHAGLDDVPVTAQILDEDGNPTSNANCSSGACGVAMGPVGAAPRLVDEGSRWVLNIPAAELRAPVVLTTMTARALGRVFLVETADGAGVPEPVEITADIAAVALGFGPLMLEGAYIYSKSCGGPSIGQATALELPELSVLTALFMARGRHASRKALRELGTTQREALDHAIEWVESNTTLVELLSEDPARVARGEFPLSETRPWVARLFGKKKAKPGELSDFATADIERLAAELGAPSAPRKPKQPDARRDELSSLVAEAFGSRGDAE